MYVSLLDGTYELFRHFYATWLYELSDHDSHATARALGHAGPTTTYGYTEVVLERPDGVATMDDLFRWVTNE